MEKVLNQAEMLAEAILESQEYISYRMTEQICMHDEKATGLIAAYSEKRHKVEEILQDPNMDKGELAAAGEELENVEHAIDENEVINKMRAANEAFAEMMKQVNAIIHDTVFGPEEAEGGCSGSCSTCGGCHH